jgi:hypothetical protein
LNSSLGCKDLTKDSAKIVPRQVVVVVVVVDSVSIAKHSFMAEVETISDGKA